jgi:GNAT superfamily N-acetyltransferase
MRADVGIPVRPDGIGFVEVTELDRSQWLVVRSMRLAALREAPNAFVNTWAAEWKLPFYYWQDRFTRALWVGAWDGLDCVGIARLAQPGPLDEDSSDVLFVESVWVDRRYRWRGVLRQMMERMEDLASLKGVTELRLWVLDTNESAGRAYQKIGFNPMIVEQATTKRRTDGSAVMERLMSKFLYSTDAEFEKVQGRSRAADAIETLRGTFPFDEVGRPSVEVVHAQVGRQSGQLIVCGDQGIDGARNAGDVVHADLISELQCHRSDA